MLFLYEIVHFKNKHFQLYANLENFAYGLVDILRFLFFNIYCINKPPTFNTHSARLKSHWETQFMARTLKMKVFSSRDIVQNMEILLLMMFSDTCCKLFIQKIKNPKGKRIALMSPVMWQTTGAECCGCCEEPFVGRRCPNVTTVTAGTQFWAGYKQQALPRQHPWNISLQCLGWLPSLLFGLHTGEICIFIFLLSLKD